MNDRTALLPAFAPPDYLWALDLLDPVAPAPLRAHEATEYRARRERRVAFRLWCAREDRRVEMLRRAGR